MVKEVVWAVRRWRVLGSVGAAVALLLWTAALAHAQAGTIAGSIVDAKTGRPLADAVVRVNGTELGARSGTRGEFRITGLSGTALSLRVTRIGYAVENLSANVGDADIRISMNALVVKLDELVVTGTAGEATKRSLGNSVGQVQVANTLQLSGPPAKLQDMLSVNVPGVRIMRASGAVGTGGTTRIRGSGSLSLSNEPLIYIDGVRTNNQAAVRSFGFNGQESPSRINDLNPEEIESIEILKGPSAATIYGTEASNGVIQIITKRGRAGRPTIETHMDAGANWLSNPEGRYPLNYYLRRGGDYRNASDIKEFRVQEFQQQRGFPAIFRTGTPIAAGASISGGSDQLRYFFSSDFNRDEGPVDYNWQNKYSGRANLSYSTADSKFKIDLSLGAIRSRTRGASGVQPVTTTIMWACNFPWCEPVDNPATPQNDTLTTGWNGAGHGFQFYRPEDYAGVEGFDNIDRTTFSLQLQHRFRPWLRHRITIGPDFTNNKSSQLVFRDPTGYNPFFAQSLGQKQSMSLRSSFLTIDYGANADWNVSKDLLASTAAGVQYYSKQFDQQVSQGFEFPVPGPGDVGSGARRDAFESFQENKTFGVYAQEQLAYKNRMFLTAALRADGNSAFGANFSAAYYPKFSFSWVLSDEPFLANSGFSQLKLRGAWGKAGLQPDVFSAIQTYGAAVGSLGLGGVTPRNFGNPDLKPEVGVETEVGFDAGLFDQKLGVEFTFYNKDISDAIISAPLKPSRGFPGVQFLNIGKTRNRGIELALDGSPVNNKNWGLDLRGTIATNSSEILTIGDNIPPIFVGSSFIQQWNVPGYAPNSFFYKNVLSADLTTSTVAGIWTLPGATNVMCEGGAIIPGTNLSAGGGAPVPCGQAPLIYAGRPTPSWNGSMSATLRIGSRLRVLGLVDYVGGHHAVVGDVGAQHTFFRNSLESIAGNAILEGYRLDPNGPGKTGLMDAGFARLRTVSATWDFPGTLTRWLGANRGSITFAAENPAFIWRAQKESYGAPWIDPELLPNRSTDVNGNFGYTQESWPQLARFRTTVRFTF
ncbi:MAG: SusC/RagA family TonB-linked outer membrane protein [Gemmatimonadales bacterium]